MDIEPIFRNRSEAGEILARRIVIEIDDTDVLVLALPRGGVPVAFPVAQVLHADLDVFLVRKLGVPGQEELAFGAIASGGVRVLNYPLIEALQISRAIVNDVVARESQELARRENLYREGKPALPIADRTVILVDDGLATGASMMAAATALRRQHPRKVIVAVPVASAEAYEEFKTHVDQTICAATPKPFFGVGTWYADFSQTSDEEVRELLDKATHHHVT